MTDIVERLRGQHLNCMCSARCMGECGCDTEWPEAACDEAADEIESLRKQVVAMRKTMETVQPNNIVHSDLIRNALALTPDDLAGYVLVPKDLDG